MKSYLGLAVLGALLSLRLAAADVTVGAVFDDIAGNLGKPTLSTLSDGNGVVGYADGLKLRIRDGKVVSVERMNGKNLTVTPGSTTTVARPGNHVSLHGGVIQGAEDSLIVRAGPADVSAIQNRKYLFLYFSAKWCGPCQQFTPKLVEFYQQYQKNGDFEVLFVSRDKDQAGMNAYMDQHSMPWVGLKRNHPLTETLKEQYGVKGIPCLVLLDENDQVVASSFQDGSYVGPDVALKAYLQRHR